MSARRGGDVARHLAGQRVLRGQLALEQRLRGAAAQRARNDGDRDGERCRQGCDAQPDGERAHVAMVPLRAMGAETRGPSGLASGVSGCFPTLTGQPAHHGRPGLERDELRLQRDAGQRDPLMLAAQRER